MNKLWEETKKKKTEQNKSGEEILLESQRHEIEEILYKER